MGLLCLPSETCGRSSGVIPIQALKKETLADFPFPDVFCDQCFVRKKSLDLKQQNRRIDARQIFGAVHAPMGNNQAVHPIEHRQRNVPNDCAGDKDRRSVEGQRGYGGECLRERLNLWPRPPACYSPYQLDALFIALGALRAEACSGQKRERALDVKPVFIRGPIAAVLASRA